MKPNRTDRLACELAAYVRGCAHETRTDRAPHALRVQDGDFVLRESAAIVSYLADKYRGRGTIDLAPAPGTKVSNHVACRPSHDGFIRTRNPKARASYDSWMLYVMTEIDAQSLYIHRKHAGLPEVYGHAPAAVESARAYFDKGAAVLSRHLEENGPWMMGGSFSGVDIVLGFCLVWARAIGWFPDHDPTLQAYDTRLRARPAFRRTFPETMSTSHPAPKL